MKSKFRLQKFVTHCARNFLPLVLVILGFAATATADTNDTLKSTSKLKKLSLDELLNQEVTIVTKRPEKLSASPSAVQVITSEDIHRSGATSIPEALRLAANLQVAQVNSRDWAISARGFNNTVANKLLVMIDGRTIYTPLYAGVFWDVQNVMLEDVDRIEVVSGPGATLWGANAVNGVINIITKSAKDTQGLLVTGAGGTQLRDMGAVRYGGKLGENLFYRVYGQHFDRNHTEFRGGNNATNAWSMTQGGFRLDWLPPDQNSLTIQGDAYAGILEQPQPGDGTVDGQNILGRWNHTFSEKSDISVQIYFDRTWRNLPTFAEDLKTYDFDFQHHVALGKRHNVVWGAGYRLMQDEVRNSAGLAFLPAHKNMQLFSGFIQDEISIIPDILTFTLGTKLEHNDFSGFEVQPSARISWTPTDKHTLWAAVSRAVRSPSRIDADLFAPGAPPFILTPTNFNSEKLIAYEIGYRVQPLEKLSLSIVGFYNRYDELRSVNTNSSGILFFGNDFKGETWGVELSGSYQVTDWWRLRGGYTYLRKELRHTSPAASPSAREGNDPEHQVVFQSMMNLPWNFEFDTAFRYVDALSSPSVPAYITCDVRLAWHYKDTLELAVVGQNLVENRHGEFGAAATRQEIPRSIYGKVTWRF